MNQKPELKQLAEQILHDPVMQKKLGDRVYELLRTELRQLQERSQGYRTRY